MTDHTPMPKVSRLEVISTGARRRWTLGEKQRIVAESHDGRRLVSATARRNGLSASQLFNWRRLAREGRLVEADEATTFAPAIISREPSTSSSSSPERLEAVENSPSSLCPVAAPRRPATSADRLAPPCANQTDAAVTCRAAAPPPTPPRRTHRIPRRSAPWSRRSSDAGVQPQPGYRPGLVAPKRQLYRRPYVRTDLPKLVRILPLKPPVTRWERSCAYDQCARVEFEGRSKRRLSSR